MEYEVVIAESARKDFAKLDARWRAILKDSMRQFLSHEPKKESKSRIKQLKGMREPKYRLRVGDMRVFYDVNDELRRVEVLGFALKPDAKLWLEEHGVPDENTHDD